MIERTEEVTQTSEELALLDLVTGEEALRLSTRAE